MYGMWLTAGTHGMYRMWEECSCSVYILFYLQELAAFEDRDSTSKADIGEEVRLRVRVKAKQTLQSRHCSARWYIHMTVHALAYAMLQCRR